MSVSEIRPRRSPISSALSTGTTPEDYVTLTEMAKAAIHMVTESIDAYVKHDTILAEKVVDEDDIVDEYFLQVKSKLIAKIAKDPDDGEYALDPADDRQNTSSG